MNDESGTRGSGLACHVVYARYPADPRVRKEVETLARRGFQLDVFSLRAPGEPSVSKTGGVRVSRLPLTAIKGSRARYAYQYAVFFLMVFAQLTVRLNTRYRVVHVHSLPDFLVFAAALFRVFGGTVVLDLHESMPELYLARFGAREGSLVHRLTLAMQKLSCSVADHIITVNPAIKALLVRRGIQASRISIVENAPDWSAVEFPDSGSQESAQHKIVIVGGLNPERDLDVVVRAAAKVKPFAAVTWRIIGYGDEAYRGRLKSLVKDLDLEHEVSIEPEVPSSVVQGLLRETTIGIVSYVRNPLTVIATPNKAYEYATLGKPMVVAALPALRDLLGNAVLYYRPSSPDSLAVEVRRLLENEQLRNSLGRLAFSVHTTHDWRTMGSRLISIYDHLIDRNHAGTWEV